MKKVHIVSSILAAALLLVLNFTGCKKFLEVKPDKTLAVPNKVEDLQALLDNSQYVNMFTSGAGEGSADNYYLTDASWEKLRNQGDKNMYIWGDELFYDTRSNVWEGSYNLVYVANVALDQLNNLHEQESSSPEKNNVRGSALFYRARVFHSLVTAFAKAYDSLTASTDLGIPLRLDPDFNIVSVRNSVEEVYRRIIKDLKIAAFLLPETPANVMRPSRPAAYGLLARVYLSMRKYHLAGLYADSALQLKSSLLDYNTLYTNASYPVPQFNEEVIFNATGQVNTINVRKGARIDSLLVSSYDAEDLRKRIYYGSYPDGSFGFKGSYFGNSLLFIGLATDELYLIRAECEAREGKTEAAMSDLNTLMIKRWKANAFVPFEASSGDEALNIILRERRKELVMRDVRWMDIKRLNKEPGHEITVSRYLKGQWYRLPPGDPRHALPLPEYILRLTGMKQNPR